MAKVKYIPCDIYKRDITVFLGSLDELKRWVKSEYIAARKVAEKLWRKEL